MYEIYTVRDGDTWESIANRYGTTVGILRQINGILNDYSINSGTQIVVPVNKKQPYQYYTVKKGDNMYDIAEYYGIDYMLLLQLNGLDEEDYIYPNQTIMLPKKGLSIYMTKNDDTLDFVLNKLGITIDELRDENENIYLQPEQILLFRNK
jgi:spore germination protein